MHKSFIEQEEKELEDCHIEKEEEICGHASGDLIYEDDSTEEEECRESRTRSLMIMMYLT